MSDVDMLLYTDRIRKRLSGITESIGNALNGTNLVKKINGVRINDEIRNNIEKGDAALWAANQFFNNANNRNNEQAKADRARKDKQQADEGPSFHRSELIAKIAEAMASADTGSVTTIKIRSGGYTVNTKNG